MRCRPLTAIAVVAVALAATSQALADGDPASDSLVFDNIFVPYPAPAAGAVSALQRNVAAAYARGFRLKVAVIATRKDLGAVPSLFGKPQDYARFLGTELLRFYAGPLLIVMPAGFGIYDAGRSTSAEQRVLSKLPATGRSANDLTRSASVAARRLLEAGALASKDITAPFVSTGPIEAKRGQTVKLPFIVGDDSGKSAATVQVRANRTVLASLRMPLQTVKLGPTYAVSWRVPLKLPTRSLQFCVVGIDASGNRSPRACATLTIT
jgi:hypothetical protein